MLKNNLDAYNDSALAFDKKISVLSNYDEAYDFFASLPGKKPEILDTACGPGNISKYLAAKIPDASFTLMDLSQEMLKVAKTHLPDAQMFCSDICDFSLGKQFDAVINGFGLPYLSSEEVVRHFKNVINHLKTGGYYYISFMNIDETRHPGQESFTQDEHPSFNLNACITVTYYLQSHILKHLEDLGFELIRKWNLDYKEMDGSVTTDVVMILKKK